MLKVMFVDTAIHYTKTIHIIVNSSIFKYLNEGFSNFFMPRTPKLTLISLWTPI